MAFQRYYYADPVSSFIRKTTNEIFGEITLHDQFGADDLQKNTWKYEIDLLKKELSFIEDGFIIFEYTIPRIGSRVDNILLYNGLVFLLEFKVGEKNYPNYAYEQVMDYALDLKCFHKESHSRMLIPMLVCTEAFSRNRDYTFDDYNIIAPISCNKNNLGEKIKDVGAKFKQVNFSYHEWINALYMPTPTIVEAAQALYRGHDVDEITRKDASAINLSQTTDAINKIIDDSKQNHKKSICFVTGVPGAGKTLAGLNISIERQNVAKDEHAVFLSGNDPLVKVLQEALARDDKQRNENTRKEDALRKAKEFIQIIHHFRDEAISVETAPIEKVVIFDEAQRAWTEPQLTDFMKTKKGQLNFNMSEPEFLISIMDRHDDWTTIICLIGGGQEINKGEAGLTEWFDAIRKDFPYWDVYVSDRIVDFEYLRGQQLKQLLDNIPYTIVPELHLGVSLRSFRSEDVSAFIKALLDTDIKTAKDLYQKFKGVYPIVITRDIDHAKKWILAQAKGSQRYGITASSKAKRLRKYGVWVQSKVDAPNWFLNDKTDVRSSYFLEETATEFDIQGLELDWSIVCWDADLRFKKDQFHYFEFKGTKWNKIQKEENITYLINAYRVLLTRARQGIVIFLPEGDAQDITRLPEFYDPTYQYLLDIGISSID